MSIRFMCPECGYSFKPERMAGRYCRSCATKLAEADKHRTELAEDLVHGKAGGPTHD
ncbi:hypothetical protein D3C81_178280 [compost metagenome]